MQNPKLLPAILVAATAFTGWCATSYADAISQDGKDVAGDKAIATLDKNAALVRRIALPELGFSGGIEFAGLTGTQDLFIPLSNTKALAGPMLMRLHYIAGTAFDARRTLVLKLNDKIVEARAIPGKASETVEFPVAVEDINSGFVKVTIAYSGAISDQRCVDQRISGAFLRILPDSGLDVPLQRNKLTIDDLPREMDVVFPADATEQQSAAAFVLGTDLDRVHFVSQDHANLPWDRTVVKFSNAEGADLSLTDASVPELILGRTRPEQAARTLLSPARTLAGQAVNAGYLNKEAGPSASSLLFSQINSAHDIQTFAEKGTWSTNLSAIEIPTGKTLGGVNLDVAVANDGADIKPVISATFNGILLGSAEAAPGEINNLKLGIPTGSVTNLNRLDVSVTRVHKGADCISAPQGYDAQVMPSSSFELVQKSGVTDFHDLASLFAGGLTIDLERGAQDVPPTSRLLGGLLGPNMAVQVTYGAAPASGPYVLVSETAPGGSKPKVSFSQGVVEVADHNGKVILSPEALGAFTVAQILKVNTQDVLWIRPGKNYSNLAQMVSSQRLALGDVAFLDGTTIKLQYSTTRDDLVHISYPNQFSFFEFLRKNRLWLIVLGWLIASYAAIWLLRATFAARSKKD